MPSYRSWRQNHEKPLRWKLWMFISLAAAILIFGATIWIASPAGWLSEFDPNEVGDTFGAVNGIASSLALVGVVMALIEQNRAMKRERDRNEATAKFREEQNKIQRETNAAMQQANKIEKFRVHSELRDAKFQQNYDRVYSIVINAATMHFVQTERTNENANPNRDRVAEFVHQLSTETDPMACFIYFSSRSHIRPNGISDELDLLDALAKVSAIIEKGCRICNAIQLGIVDESNSIYCKIDMIATTCMIWERIMNEVVRSEVSLHTQYFTLQSNLQNLLAYMKSNNIETPSLPDATDKFCVPWNRSGNN